MIRVYIWGISGSINYYNVIYINFKRERSVKCVRVGMSVNYYQVISMVQFVLEV